MDAAHARSRLAALARRYGPFKTTRNRLDEGDLYSTYYDNARRGVAFVLTPAGNGAPGAVPDFTVIVHKAGTPVITF